MSDLETADLSARVLILAPTARDAKMCHKTLGEAGIVGFICKSLDELCSEMERGAGAAIVTQEAIFQDRAARLTATLAAQPPWSDFPLVVLTPAGQESARAGRALEAIGHMTLVKRPVPLQVLVSAMKTALRDRSRQYATRDHLEERERQVAGLTLEVAARKRAEEALHETDRRKDEFLAMLAHELRNPLAAISAATRVLAAPEVGAEDLEWGRGVLERQVRQLTRLIDDLLDVSRITSGKVRLRRENFDAAPVLKSAIEVVQPLIDERKHEVTVSMTPGPLRLFADATRVEQILVNLLTNAAKYTDSGGRITVSASQDGGQVVFRVRDNGVGIPPELLPRLFDLFAQGDRSLARSEGGLGIGLTLVKALAEMHGGSATVASEGIGLGSEFVVRLPAAPARSADPGSAASPDWKRTPGSSRILVVDDNADAARGLARLLKLLGHEVRVAHDGPSALQAAREYGPGIVLLDIGLPGMDGYEVAARLRREPWCQGVFLIAVTGYGQDQDRKKAHESGFDHHLVKPVDYDALTTLIGQPGINRGLPETSAP